MMYRSFCDRGSRLYWSAWIKPVAQILLAISVVSTTCGQEPTPVSIYTGASGLEPTNTPKEPECPEPLAVMGQPLFQSQDPDGNLYAVAWQRASARLLLVRYNTEGSLDISFGVCGVHRQAWSGAAPSIQDGVIHEGNFYLALADPTSTSLLAIWPLTGDDYRLVSASAGVSIHSLMIREGTLYYSGDQDGHFLVGQASLPLAPGLATLPGGLMVSLEGTGYALAETGDRLYAAGQGPYHGKAYQYRQSCLTPEPFAPGKDEIDTRFQAPLGQTWSRVRALAAHGGWLYLAGDLDSPGRNEDLFIRRYRLANGEADEDFAITLATDLDNQTFPLEYSVRLEASGNGLTLCKYTADGSQMFAGAWDWQGQQASDSGLYYFPNITRLAQGLVPGQMSLLGTDQDGALRVERISWPGIVPLTNASFGNIGVRGHYRLTENVYLNVTGRSPWTPFPLFRGTLDGNGHAIYGLHINESTPNIASGLFRRIEDGEVKNLIFVDPEIYSGSDAGNTGLVAGELVRGNVISIVLWGGWMECSGRYNYRAPTLGTVGWASEHSRVVVMARNMTQVIKGDYSLVAFGVGYNEGTVHSLVQNSVQHATGAEVFIAVAAADNKKTGMARGVAHNLVQTTSKNATLTGSGMAVGAAKNRGTAQGLANQLVQTATEDFTEISVGAAGNNYGTAQGIGNNVTQTGTGYGPAIGIGAAYNSRATAQALGKNMTQSGGAGADIGIDAGFSSGAGATTQGKLLTEKHKAYNLTQLGLTARQEDWTTGDDTQYPMLIGLDGGYQDLRRLSSDFALDMADFAPPSSNMTASWLGPVIWNTLRQWQCAESPAVMAQPLFQIHDPDGYLYTVAYQAASARLLLVRYDAQGARDMSFGICGVDDRAWSEPHPPSIRVGVIHQGQLYLALVGSAATDLLAVWPLSGGDYRLMSAPSGVAVYSMMVRENSLYYGGHRGGHFLVGQASLPLAPGLAQLPGKVLVSGQEGAGYALAISGERLYAAGQGSHYGQAYQYRPCLAPTFFSPGEGGFGHPFQQQSQARALVVHDGWLYLAGDLDHSGHDGSGNDGSGHNAGGNEDLFIRRYRLADGEPDEGFAITLATGLDRQVPPLEYDVRLETGGNGLTLLKYINDDNQIFAGFWDWQGQPDPDNGLFDFPSLAQLARGLAPENTQLAGTDWNGLLQVGQVTWPFPAPGTSDGGQSYTSHASPSVMASLPVSGRFYTTAGNSIMMTGSSLSLVTVSPPAQDLCPETDSSQWLALAATGGAAVGFGVAAVAMSVVLLVRRQMNRPPFPSKLD